MNTKIKLQRKSMCRQTEMKMQDYREKIATGVPIKAQGTCPKEGPQVGSILQEDISLTLACQDTHQISTHD